MNINVAGKTALVTGSTSGIGRKSAEQLARQGASVYINGRKETTVLPCIEELKKLVPNGKFLPATGDVSTKSGVEDLLKRIPAVDILVNNTGIFETKPFFDIPDEDWQCFFDVNVMSGVRLSRGYLKKMLEKNWGRIVFISSESGIQIPTEMIHYGMTKSAQISVARGLAELTKGTNVTVNTLLVGPTDTAGVREYMRRYADQRGVPVDEFEKVFMNEVRPTTLLDRLLSEQEVANMVGYVCSPASSGTNGAALRVEGGLLRCIP